MEVPVPENQSGGRRRKVRCGCAGLSGYTAGLASRPDADRILPTGVQEIKTAWRMQDFGSSSRCRRGSHTDSNAWTRTLGLCAEAAGPSFSAGEAHHWNWNTRSQLSGPSQERRGRVRARPTHAPCRGLGNERSSGMRPELRNLESGQHRALYSPARAPDFKVDIRNTVVSLLARMAPRHTAARAPTPTDQAGAGCCSSWGRRCCRRPH